jgi:hypothetical protein
VKWNRLSRPSTVEDRRSSRQLWDEVRAGKEMLSRATSTTIHVPLFDDDAPLGREQLDQLALPIVERTVTALRSALHSAGVAPDTLSGLFLVGGASRMPLATTRLHQALGVTPNAIEQPEVAVAEGSLFADGATNGDGEDSDGVTGTASPVRPAAPAVPARSPKTRRRAVAAAGIVVTAAVLAAIVIQTANSDDGRGDGAQAANATSGTRSADPAGALTPSSHAASNPPPTPLVDPCLVGTWQLVQLTEASTVFGVEVRFTGHNATYIYRADGTATIDYGTSHVRDGDAGGKHYQEFLTGSIDFHFATTNSQLISTGHVVNGRLKIFINGTKRYDDVIHLTGYTTPATYSCVNDRLVVTGADQSTESRRIPSPGGST